METFALLGGMVVILMIGAPSILISPNRICLDGLWPPKVWQIANDQKGSFVRDTERGESHWLLLLANSPLSSLTQLVWGLRTPCLGVLGRTISDQDLLRSYSDIVFEHKIYIHPSEQVINRCWWLLCKRFKEGCARVDTSLEDLQDGIHTARFYLEYCLPEPLHEVSE